MSGDSDIEDLLRHRLQQEHRFTNLEGRVTALESSVKEVKLSVDDAKGTLSRWALGVIASLGLFTLGLIVTLIQIATK